MQLTIAKKGLILVTLPLLFQLTFLWLLRHLERSHAEAERWTIHSRDVISQSGTVLKTLLDAETGNRGFVITGDEIFTEPYQRGVKEFPEALRNLTKLVSDNPQQVANATRISQSGAQLFDWLAQIQMLMRSSDRAGAVERVKSRTGKNYMDSVRGELAEFLAEEATLSAAREQSLRQARAELNWVFLFGGVASFVTTVGLGILFSRGIRRRLKTLIDNTRLLSKHETLAPPVGGTDEIAQLDKVFHAMADSLAEAAERQREYTGSLEQRVSERTRELTRTNRDLAQQSHENEMFVYSVSHDLRSPLVNLLGFSKELTTVSQDLKRILADAQLPTELRERGAKLIDQDMQKSIHFIQSAVTRLSGIIDGLLRLSRAGRIEYQVQHVDVEQTVARIIEALSLTIHDRGAEITVRPLPPLWGDAQAVEQVFANLISNALNYLDPQRAGHIEIGSLPLEERPPDNNPTQTYYVKDNGLGVPEAYQSKLFQAFKRLHPNAAKGEGMGLAIVRRIVERHGGRIWVESTAGVGSTFFVALPAELNAMPLPRSESPMVEERSFCDDGTTVGHFVGGR